MLLISPKKPFSFSTYLRFCPKRLDKKDKVNFKFHDVTAWLTNNRNTHITQYFEKLAQSDYKIWSVNRM